MYLRLSYGGEDDVVLKELNMQECQGFKAAAEGFQKCDT